MSQYPDVEGKILCRCMCCGGMTLCDIRGACDSCYRAGYKPRTDPEFRNYVLRAIRGALPLLERGEESVSLIRGLLAHIQECEDFGPSPSEDYGNPDD